MFKKPSTPFETSTSFNLSSSFRHFISSRSSSSVPKVTSSQKTLPLGHPGSYSVPETPELLNPSSNDRSYPISVVGYATQSSFMLIMCNTPQHEQLWTVADFLACNFNKPAPLIAAVTTCKTCRSHSRSSISSPTAQWSINRSLPLTKWGPNFGNSNSVHSFQIPVILMT